MYSLMLGCLLCVCVVHKIGQKLLILLVVTVVNKVHNDIMNAVSFYMLWYILKLVSWRKSSNLLILVV